MGCIGSRTIAAEAVPVSWKDSKDLDNVHLDSTVSLQGSNTQHSSAELSMEDTKSILPSLSKSSNPYGIGALAKSSLSVRLHSGLSKTVKDHITKPTAMGSGRMAHMIEWQGWSKQPPAPSPHTDSPMDPDTYSDLSDGEKEARFLAGVMKQFAISEATLIAWSSMDGEVSDVSTPGQSGQLNGHEGSDQQDPNLQLFPESWPHLVSQGMYCLSTSGVWDPSTGQDSPLDHRDVPGTEGEAEGLASSETELRDGFVPSPATEPSPGAQREGQLGINPLSRKVSDVTSSGVQSLEEDEDGM